MKIFYQKMKNSIRVRSVQSLSPTLHFHSHIEILYLLSGSVRAFADSKQFNMSSGDLFVSFPNQIHSYINDGDINAILIILPENFFDEYSSVMSTKLPQSAILPDSKCNNEIKWLIEQIYFNAYSTNNYRKSIIKGYAQALMGEILERSELLDNDNSANDILHDILLYCNNNYRNSELSLSILAENLHRSKHYISHVFSNKIKMNFNDYINTLRIDEACKLINADNTRPLSEVAYEVGFGSIRTFNRAFLKFRNDTPRNYKK